MDWRSYDPTIGRWIAMDPVTHFSMSPYTAFDNNPIYWRDPSGMDSEYYEDPPTRDGEYVDEIVKNDGEKYIWDGKKWDELLDDAPVEPSIGDYEDDPMRDEDGRYLDWEEIDWQEVYKDDIDALISSMHGATGRAAEVITEVALWVAPVPGLGAATGLATKGITKLMPKVLMKLSSKGAAKVLPRSGLIMKSLGAASRQHMLARKLKMNINSPTTRQVLNSLDDTVETFISGFRKPSIRAKLPGEFINMTVEEALKSGNTTVRKLLTDGRFVK